MNVIDEMIRTLKIKFPDAQIAITDESIHHAQHAQAQASGGGHFALRIISPRFKRMTLIDRHRLIHVTLQEFFDAKHIHALAVKAFTPEEWQERGERE